MTKGKQYHFLKLYEPIHDKFERFCRARVYGRMDYRDLMNESLLIAYQKFEHLRSEQAFFSFLIGISVRVLANHHKKKKEDSIEQLDRFDAGDVNANSETATEIYLLHKALALLPDEQRECIILFEISGFSIKEIMDIQQASEPAIKQRLKRGRDKLKALLTFESSNYKGGEK